MATQAQWFAKLCKFVPSWHFEQQNYEVARFQAMAAVLAGLDDDAQDHFNAVFITRAPSPVLQDLGAERGLTQNVGESNIAFALRIQQITSHTDKPDIQATINSLLLIGTCKILEVPEDSPYCSRLACCTRDNLILEARRNYFLVQIPPQIHAPYSFCARSYFNARLNFVGSQDSTGTIFASIIAAINNEKAFGVMYGVVEKS